MVYAFVALLGLMAPIVWIPEGSAAGLFVLRHFQTVALTFGLFLCVAGIVILLRDLMAYGEARVSFQAPDVPSAVAEDESDVEIGPGFPRINERR